MRLLQVSVILFSGHHSMHFHTKLNEMQRYVRPRQQQSRIIASLWNCELLLLLSRTWKSCGHFYIHIGTITLWRKWERPSKQTFAKQLVMSLLAPCSQESVKFWYGLSIYFEKKVTDESERQAKALSILIGGGTTYVVKIATKFSSTWALAQLKRKVA